MEKTQHDKKSTIENSRTPLSTRLFLVDLFSNRRRPTSGEGRSFHRPYEPKRWLKKCQRSKKKKSEISGRAKKNFSRFGAILRESSSHHHTQTKRTFLNVLEERWRQQMIDRSILLCS